MLAGVCTIKRSIGNFKIHIKAMFVTFSIAFLYINDLFRFLKQKVIIIKNANNIVCDTLEKCNNEIQNVSTCSDTVSVENGSNAENEKSSRIQVISRSSSSNQLPFTIGTENVNIINFENYENTTSSSECDACFGFDSNGSSEQEMNKKSAEKQNQNNSCVEKPVNTTNSNASEQDNYQENASNTSNYCYTTESEFETDRGIKFYPQVFIQRYNSVTDVLTCETLRGKIKKVS